MAHTTKTNVLPPKVTVIPKQMEHEKPPKRPSLLTFLLSILAIIALIHLVAVMHPTDAQTISSATCASLLRTTDYTQTVHLQSSSQEMEAVQLTDSLVSGQSAALVQVMNTNAHTLDAYVYGCTVQKAHPTLTLLFSQKGIVQGTADISTANTLLISQPDTTLSGQVGIQLQPSQQNVYREYSWQNGTFVQQSYASLYPVTSRSEAELLQQQADNGQSQQLWIDPLTTAEQMAKDIFNWSTPSSQDAVISNDGITAQVKIVQESPHLDVLVTLSRLVQHDDKGLWFVTAAQTQGITLTSPPNPMTSPLTLSGTGAVTDGVTTAKLFDHTLASLPLLNDAKLSVDASGTYTGQVFYTNAVPNQPGLLLIESLPPNGSTEQGQLLLTSAILG